jgi:hypothetical protein
VQFVPMLAIAVLPNVASTTTSIAVVALNLVVAVPNLAVRCRWQWHISSFVYLNKFL